MNLHWLYLITPSTGLLDGICNLFLCWAGFVIHVDGDCKDLLNHSNELYHLRHVEEQRKPLALQGQICQGREILVS